VIQGKPSPRVGRPSRDCAAAGRAVVVEVDAEVVDVGAVVGGVTV
jgi:hypothetical protein